MKISFKISINIPTVTNLSNENFVQQNSLILVKANHYQKIMLPTYSYSYFFFLSYINFFRFIFRQIQVHNLQFLIEMYEYFLLIILILTPRQIN